MTSILLEAVPNFSEGRDPAFAAGLPELLTARAGIRLLDLSADADHNRSVATFAGKPADVVDGLLAAAAFAVERIDLRRHRGAHPRIGALDVAPLVPLGGASWDEAIAAAREIASRLWDELGVPSYFYGRAALRPEREQLESFRARGFERLSSEASDPAWRPDVGGPALHPSAGATAVGVRKPLIAYNVNLATADPGPARRIARAIRESSGGLLCVKALGLELERAGLTQVSMNLTDYEVTPPHAVYERIVELARAEGVEPAGAELIGLMPRAALIAAGARHLGLEGADRTLALEDAIEQAFADQDEAEPAPSPPFK